MVALRNSLSGDPRPRGTAVPTAPLLLTPRDHQIVALARAKLQGARADFPQVVRALREAVEERILGGRLFLLGATPAGPILGSLLTGVGIVDDPAGVQLVRAVPGRPLVRLARFGP